MPNRTRLVSFGGAAVLVACSGSVVAVDGGPTDAATSTDVGTNDSAPLGDSGSADSGSTGKAPQQLDLVGKSDTALAPDGLVDGTVITTLSGPIDAIALVTTDASGASTASQIWDTVTGADAISKDLGVPFALGSQTWILGVSKSGVLLNDKAGHVSLPAGVHQVELTGSDSGFFKTGQHFRVYSRSADKWLAGPVFTW